MASRHERIGIYRGLIHPSCRWANDDGTETIIAKIDVDGVEETIKGTIFPGQLARDVCYRFYGAVREYKGKEQFVFETFVTETPADESSIVAYLTQCKSIGPAVARAIFRQFGANSVAKLREHPESVAETTPRLTVERAIEASEFLKKFEHIERSKIDLFGMLKGRGIPKKVLETLLNRYGSEAAEIVSRNPYILLREKGVGFKRADDLYLDLQLPRGRMKRQALCAWYAVDKAGNGDTWVPFDEVRFYLAENISSADVDIERAMTLAIRGKLLVQRFHQGRRWVADYQKAKDEHAIADYIIEAESESARVLWGDDVIDALRRVSDHQRENAAKALAGFIGILSGRPGSGKSFTVAEIVTILADLFGLAEIAVAAPTGKAAVRVTAAMESVGINLVAKTLHSLLGFQGDGFEYTRSNPLPYKFVIVDEGSMIDVPMMRCLFAARAEGSHILLVGDPNQLPPVGHGAPLRDLIAASIPNGELREIQRNSGRIVKACGEIIDHGRLGCSAKLHVSSGENLAMIECDDVDQQIATLVSLFQRFQRDFEAGTPNAVDPVWGVQVIVATNESGELGRKQLNKRLQDLLNPNGVSVPGCPFRVGDKIICGKNGDYKSVDPSSIFLDGEDVIPKFRVANGEQAEVVTVEPNRIVARLTLPDRTIVIPRAAKKSAEADQGEDDESGGTGCDWELAFAISGHKSQGSEWPYAIVMIDDSGSAKRVQSKQWIYTAISRAKRIGFLIGKQRTANDCCRRDSLYQRKTFLKELIVDARSHIELTEALSGLVVAGGVK